jgi:hypothetical protein
MVKYKIVDGLSINKDAKLEFCKGCTLGKQHRELFLKEGGSRATKILGLVLRNIWEPMKTSSFKGMWYVLCSPMIIQ